MATRTQVAWVFLLAWRCSRSWALVPWGCASPRRLRGHSHAFSSTASAAVSSTPLSLSSQACWLPDTGPSSILAASCGRRRSSFSSSSCWSTGCCASTTTLPRRQCVVADLLNGLGTVYGDQGRARAAEAAFGRAVEVAPDCAQPRFSPGVLYLRSLAWYDLSHAEAERWRAADGRQ